MTVHKSLYDSLIRARKYWADHRFLKNAPDVSLDQDISARKYLRYKKWIERDYRSTRKTEQLFEGHWRQGYKLGWRLNIWGREDPHHWRNVETAMYNMYRDRKRWKVCNTSTGHLFAWRMKQKAKRNWPR